MLMLMLISTVIRGVAMREEEGEEEGDVREASLRRPVPYREGYGTTSTTTTTTVMIHASSSLLPLPHGLLLLLLLRPPVFISCSRPGSVASRRCIAGSRRYRGHRRFAIQSDRKWVLWEPQLLVPHGYWRPPLG